MQLLSRGIAIGIMFVGMYHGANIVKEKDPFEPVRALVASVDLRQIGAALIRDELIEGKFPETARFGQFIQESFKMKGKKIAKDPWGTPYGYELLTRSKALVYSCGPDKIHRTEDDLRITVNSEE
ncbi:hypothetical protein ACFL1X_07740 [Candidatus Hydrogenedentota bacterium]